MAWNLVYNKCNEESHTNETHIIPIGFFDN